MIDHFDNPWDRVNQWITPCFPAFLPVMKEGQFGTVPGGSSTERSRLTPSSSRRLKLGRWPSLTQGLTRSKVPPSRPMTKTFFEPSLFFFFSIIFFPFHY